MTNTITKITLDGDDYELPEGFTPDNAGTTDDVLTKTANGYEWSAPTGGISLDANSPITVSKIRVGTEQQYQALSSYDNSTVYMTV